MNRIRGKVIACNFREKGFLVTLDAGHGTTMEFNLREAIPVGAHLSTLAIQPSSIILLQE